MFPITSKLLAKPLSIVLLSIATIGLASAEQPNIVLIIADDLGPNDTGFIGNNEVRTPALDRLTTCRAVFENVYAASPSCAPSRERYSSV